MGPQTLLPLTQFCCLLPVLLASSWTSSSSSSSPPSSSSSSSSSSSRCRPPRLTSSPTSPHHRDPEKANLQIGLKLSLFTPRLQFLWKRNYPQLLECVFLKLTNHRAARGHSSNWQEPTYSPLPTVVKAHHASGKPGKEKAFRQ